jgi:hypothetical protein
MPDDFQQRLEELDRQARFLKRCVVYGLLLFSVLLTYMHLAAH